MLKAIKMMFELLIGLFSTFIFILLFPLYLGLVMPVIYGVVYKEQHNLKDFVKAYLNILLILLKPQKL